jgi:acetyl esterase/lipase
MHPLRFIAGLFLVPALFLSIPSLRAEPPPVPWKSDVPYGDHELQKIDLYRPQGKGPFPVIIHIHGGGWWNGDKKYLSASEVKRFLDKGCALVSINYRFLPQAHAAGIFPPVLGPLHDAMRALQFVRHQAAEWDLDPTRTAVYGESAGACSSLWLALSPEMAEPGSADPVARQSTRVLAVGGSGAQTSLDPVQMREWVGPGLNYGGHAFGLKENEFEIFLNRRAEFEKYFPAISPAALLDKDDPPIYLSYGTNTEEPKKDHMYYVHSPAFGIGFQKLAAEKGAVCHLSVKGTPSSTFQGDMIDFLIASVSKPTPFRPLTREGQAPSEP